MCSSLRFINKPYKLTIYINEKGFQLEAFFVGVIILSIYFAEYKIDRAHNGDQIGNHNAF